jgi:hypothetical protein
MMATSPTASAQITDVLNSLLEAEQNSVFRFMDEGSPYLGRATAEVRKPLQEMVQQSIRHVELLSSAVDSLGGVPSTRGIQLEEQYLAFLSLKFLLPKLVDAKKLAIERYENAIRAVPGAPAEIKELLHGLLAYHHADLKVLQHAAAHVASGK